MSLLTLILIVLLLVLLLGGGYANWGPGRGYAYGAYPGWYYGGGLVSLVLVILLILVLTGRL